MAGLADQALPALTASVKLLRQQDRAEAGKEWVDNRFHTYQPEELVRLALSKPARFEPGTDWSYTNYVLARLLIEKVTGRTIAEEMQRLIIGPRGPSVRSAIPCRSPFTSRPGTVGA
ncbi:serine hydrolase [Nonomuraea sp. PA05]|uniref:serine hydrolase n=1 Tax=Nonomuraea sp. PA05 TaxID=2604466 RepID=UPI0021CCFAB7|nr:serine hydrolase domain-containing protein [Nonomuraea sp. PA05]